jgi:hypothetical protein
MTTVAEEAAEVTKARVSERVAGVRLAEAMVIQGGRTEEVLGEVVKGVPEEVLEETEQVVVMEGVVAEEGQTAEEGQVGHKHRRQAQRRRPCNLAFRRVPVRVV